ncbi:MAG TPA: hypothetical protein VNU93_08230 [Verrucomicrobiae bacterium]|nr:hypothetical protein [Verrucomicrobiae bacterium]
MKHELDWNDYVEPEMDGPEVHCIYRCPKCGHREIIPDTGTQCSLTVTCPTCKTKMLEDTER